jgi:excisionase family DNA binding protein
MALEKYSELLTSREVADLFGVTTETVRNWAIAGRLTAHPTPGGRLRFRRDEVERFIPAVPSEPAA